MEKVAKKNLDDARTNARIHSEWVTLWVAVWVVFEGVAAD